MEIRLETDLIKMALIMDMLRMFTPIAGNTTPELSSCSLKHIAENFLSPRCSYASNGRLIWAPAAERNPAACRPLPSCRIHATAYPPVFRR